MEKHLSPKQVARAIGVSESSLKRWCDQGLLSVVRTSGGHRRLPLSSVLEFVRARQFPVSQPELLGLPPIRGVGVRVLDHAREEFLAALAEGHEAVARQILFELYLSGATLATLCDTFLSAALRHFRELHAEKSLELYRLRRAEQILGSVLYELQVALPATPPAAALALGGTLAATTASLASKMVELILRKAGWQAQSLGAALTASTLQCAIQDCRPKLCWLSLEATEDPQAIASAVDALQLAAVAHGAQLVVSGSGAQAIPTLAARGIPCCEDLQQWETLLSDGTLRVA